VACVRRRRGKWVLDYRDSLGVRRWRSFDTKREAEDAQGDAVRDSRQASTPSVNPEITVEAYSARWLEMIAPTLKPRSLEGYKEKLRNYIRPSLGPVRVRRLQRGRIKAFLSARLASGLSANSVRLIHATLRGMLNAAVDDGVILANPAARLGRQLRLTRSTTTRQENIKALDRNQVARFLAGVLKGDPGFYPTFLAMARAGLRIGEALALKWIDFDFNAREIRVERSVSAGVLDTPKSGHGRTVDMSQSLRSVLLELHVRQQKDALRRGEQPPTWCFPSTAGGPWTHVTAGKVFKRTLKAAGLPMHHTPHSLRHTFASLLLQQGVSPVYVQRQLGHASIKLTVDTYGRWLPMGNKAAVDGLDDPQPEQSGSKVVAAGADRLPDSPPKRAGHDGLAPVSAGFMAERGGFEPPRSTD